MRRILAFAFSEKTLREQEPILRNYVDLIIQKLREESQGGKLVDIVNWYNYTTFDIIGDLCFGESFHNLDNKGEHAWISGVLKAVKGGMLHAQTRVIPPLNLIVKHVMPIYLKGARSSIFGFAQERVDRCLMQEMERPDFMTYVLRSVGTEKGLCRPEIDTNFLMLTKAGSETTATTLSACTYYLLRNPQVLRRRKEEIRGTFESEQDIIVGFFLLIELPRLSLEFPTVLPINPNSTLQSRSNFYRSAGSKTATQNSTGTEGALYSLSLPGLVLVLVKSSYHSQAPSPHPRLDR